MKGLIMLKIKMQVSSFYCTRSLVEDSIKKLEKKFQNINIDATFILAETIPNVLNLTADGKTIYGDIIYGFWVDVVIDIYEVNDNFIDEFINQATKFIENNNDIDLITVLKYEVVKRNTKQVSINNSIEKDIFNVENENDEVLRVLNKRKRKIVVLKKDGDENDSGSGV
jgi:uncharacterized LabA/DUF88 family protein